MLTATQITLANAQAGVCGPFPPPPVRTQTKAVPGGRPHSAGGRSGSGVTPARSSHGRAGRSRRLSAPLTAAPRPAHPGAAPGKASQRRHDNTRPSRVPPRGAPPGAAGTHLMTVPLAPPAVVSMTRVVRLPRRSSGSKPSSAAQHSSAGWLRGLGVQPPAGKDTAVTAPRPAPACPHRPARRFHTKLQGKKTTGGGGDLALTTRANVSAEATQVCLWK